MSAPSGNDNAVGNKGGGRKTVYNKSYVKIAGELCRLGATDKDIANAFCVCETTINAWKNKYIEFNEALKKSKSHFDARIERSLAERALGYSHMEDKIFNNSGEALIVSTMKHYPPDTTACIFWLKNRMRSEWCDKPEETSGGVESLAEALSKLADKLPN